MRAPRRYISLFLLLVYLGLTTAGSGHGSWSHVGHDHDHAHQHAHKHHSCDHSHASNKCSENVDPQHSHECQLCDWLGQAQSDDATYPLLLAETLAIVSVSLSSPVHSRDRGREALPRGPPTAC